MSGNFAIKGGGVSAPNGKCHLKFPFWFFDYLPYLEQFIFLPKPWCSIYGENYHWSIFESFWKESMINQLSNLINRTRSAAKISQFFLYLLAPHKTPCFQKYWQIVGIKAQLFSADRQGGLPMAEG